MQYLEDLWDIEIRPVKIQWACLNSKNELVFKKTETGPVQRYICTCGYILQSSHRQKRAWCIG